MLPSVQVRRVDLEQLLLVLHDQIKPGITLEFDVSSKLNAEEATALEASEQCMQATLAALIVCGTRDLDRSVVSDELLAECVTCLKHHLLHHVFPVSDPSLKARLVPGTIVQVCHSPSHVVVVVAATDPNVRPFLLACHRAGCGQNLPVENRTTVHAAQLRHGLDGCCVFCGVQAVTQLRGLASACSGVLDQLLRVIQAVHLRHAVLSQLADLCVKALLVQGPDVHGLKTRCASVLVVSWVGALCGLVCALMHNLCWQEMFAHHEDQRDSIITDVFGILNRLPTSQRHLRTFSVPGSSTCIQQFTALVLQLIQCSAKPPTARDIRRSQDGDTKADGEGVRPTGMYWPRRTSQRFVSLFLERCGSKDSAKEFRLLLKNFVEDVISVIDMPEWPSAVDVATIICHSLWNKRNVRVAAHACQSVALTWCCTL